MKEIKGSLDIDDEQVAGFVLARSVKDASIRSAWTNRRDNPAAFTRVVAALRGGLEEYVEQQRRKYQNQEAVADRDAVASAVRGANLSRPLPEPGPDFGRMTDREFQQWKNENMRP